MQFHPVEYSSLDSRQRENYNFQKVSGVLADYGFSTIRLTADWQGADFVAQHADGQTFLKVQLKPRLYFSKNYIGKDLWMCFPAANGGIYLFRHDEVVKIFLDSGRTMAGTESWEQKGVYSFNHISGWVKRLLDPYFLPEWKPASELAQP